MITYISEAFTHGGIWMYAILGIHIFSIAIIIERLYFLYLRRSNNQKKLAKIFEADIKKGQIEQAFNRATSLSQSKALGSVAAAGIQAAMNMGGKDEIHARMEEMISAENAKLEKRTPLLSMIGNVATLVGLLGTITGMIKSFSAVSMASGAEKATLLSNGISEAMNCTAYGLVVAIPALFMYSILSNRTNDLIDDLNQASTKVLNWLCYSFENIPGPKSKRRSS
ncbi:MAG: MotA/TolQ/ExbB proton channel family protein [Bdellovibrionales bacterium]|nr:MotA/TolQ/ExbB proton channel family protein [Bdellovibrionales bacterium]